MGMRFTAEMYASKCPSGGSNPQALMGREVLGKAAMAVMVQVLSCNVFILALIGKEC
jgi:hypothetical protein